MGAQPVLPLLHLNAEEAWNLFKKAAGDYVESPEIRPIADEIVKHCEGLPVAIVTIAKALKMNSVPAWKNALEELKNAAPTNVREVSEKVYTCLKLSYDHLESDEAKSLFLLCGLLEDAHISMDRLLLYCMGLNLFKGLHSWEKTANKVIALVEGLKASSLLLEPDQKRAQGSYGSMFFDDAFIKMHDVVRDVARLIASNQCVVREAAELTAALNYSRISLECGDMDELPQRLVCPELELFLLDSRFNGGEDMRIPDDFFQGLTKLRIVHLSGVSLGPSLGSLSNLHALCLNKCRLLDMAAVGELKSLQALSLAGSNIEELPKEIKQLRDLRVLDLRDCGDLRIIPQDVISSLSQLEYLSLKGCRRIEWERDGVKSLSEVKHLPKLKTLQLDVSDASLLPDDGMLFHKNVNLSRYSIVISKTIYCRGHSRTLVAEDVKSLEVLLNCFSQLFKSVQELRVRRLNDIKEVVYELDRDHHGFPELKNLAIEECPNIEYILGSRRDHQYFRNLRYLSLSGCKRLKYAFASSTMELAFPDLQELEMWNLPELISFFYSTTTTTTTEGRQERIPIFNGQVSFPALGSLTVRGLINTQALWEKQLVAADSFSKVNRFELRSCHKLQNVFPLCVAKALVQLEDLIIVDCDGVETIVVDEEEEESAVESPPPILFPKVTELSLIRLPQLKRFCSCTRFTLKWPALESLEVWGCGQVEVVFQGLIGPSEGDQQLDDINTIQQSLFLVDQDAFPALKFLSIRDSNGMRALWYSPQISADFCPRLKILVVNRCNKLLNIFPLSVAKALGQLEELNIKCCEAVEEIVTSHEDETVTFLSLFPNLTSLGLTRLPQLKNFCTKRFASRWPHLKTLRLEGCDKLEICFVQETSVEGGGGLATTEIRQPFFLLQKGSFLALESLTVGGGLINTQALWEKPLETEDFFTKIKKLSIIDNPKLQNVFPLCVAKALVQLEYLSIKGCDGVETIVVDEEEDESALVPSLILFPKVTYLRLDGLPQLKRFCSCTRFTLRWPALKRLEVWECSQVEVVFQGLIGPNEGDQQQLLFLVDKEAFPNLEELTIINLKEAVKIWQGHFSGVSFSKLRELRIKQCHRISIAIPTILIQALHNLKILEVRGCDSMNEVIQVVDGESPTNDEIYFPKLWGLELEDLRNLNSFCSTTCIFRFPSLSQVTVQKCPKMELFCKGDLQAPMLKYEWMGDLLRQYWETNLNTTIQLIRQAHLQGTIEELQLDFSNSTFSEEESDDDQDLSYI